MMKLTVLAATAPTLIVLASACGADSVEASAYDQSCSTADDCVAVNELQADGKDCTIRCASGAINKKDQSKFDADVRAARGCTQLAQPFCDAHVGVECMRGKCSASPAPADAGPTEAPKVESDLRDRERAARLRLVAT